MDLRWASSCKIGFEREIKDDFGMSLLKRMHLMREVIEGVLSVGEERRKKWWWSLSTAKRWCPEQLVLPMHYYTCDAGLNEP